MLLHILKYSVFFIFHILCKKGFFFDKCEKLAIYLLFLFVFSREPQLYKRVCPFVGPSVGTSVGP